MEESFPLGDGVHVSFERWKEEFVVLTTQDEDGEETARIVLGAAAWRRLEKLIADRRRTGQETKP